MNLDGSVRKEWKKNHKPEKWCQKGFPDLGWARSGDQPNLPFWTAALISTKNSILGIFQFGPWFWWFCKKESNWPRPNLQQTVWFFLTGQSHWKGQKFWSKNRFLRFFHLALDFDGPPKTNEIGETRLTPFFGPSFFFDSFLTGPSSWIRIWIIGHRFCGCSIEKWMVFRGFSV